jgi:hypothetical protein
MSDRYRIKQNEAAIMMILSKIGWLLEGEKKS